MIQVNYLNSVINKAIIAFEQVKTKGAKKYYSFEIGCEELEDFNKIPIQNSEKYRSLFMNLMEISGPVVYWFEIISDINSEKIITELNHYKLKKERNTPAIRKNINPNSKILYVGKVKLKFFGRFIQHLGFYKNNQTQGLQLFYWAKEISIKLKVHVLEFEKDMEDYIPIIELEFSKYLEPLIGKHK